MSKVLWRQGRGASRVPRRLSQGGEAATARVIRGQSRKLTMSVAKESDDLQLLPCSFQFHDFHDQVGEVRLVCQMMKMDNSLYLWVGDYNEQNMKDLSLAFTMENEPKKPVVSTKILGAVVDETSVNIANRLSKKTGIPIYVSFNANADNLTLPNIERRIYEELKKHPELLEL